LGEVRAAEIESGEISAREIPNRLRSVLFGLIPMPDAFPKDLKVVGVSHGVAGTFGEDHTA
jgi:hypothetical protein